MENICFDTLDEIVEKVCDYSLQYQEEISKINDLRSRIQIARKYVSLTCNHWICQDCFSTDCYELPMEVVCGDCGTIDDDIKLWCNSIGVNQMAYGYGYIDTHECRNRITRTMRFREFIQQCGIEIDTDTTKLMVRNYIQLEQIFDQHKEEIGRKNFFLNKIMLQRLLEHYKLAKPLEKTTKTMKTHYDAFEQLKWP